MAKSEIVNLRVSPEERASLDAAAKKLGITVSEAARIGVATMAERVAKSGSAGAQAEASFITRQPEWQAYLTPVAGGHMDYDDAVVAAGKAITARLKREVEKANAEAREVEVLSKMYGRQ
jgi:hypothetical protein